MKGLLIKDFCLLRSQKKILPIYLIMTVWFTAMHNDSFAFPFLMMMAMALVGSTISYDEIDRSQTHLFTLPVHRKTYVQEKYVLGGIILAASLLLAILCRAIRLDGQPEFQETDLGPLIVLSTCAGVAMISVMIPIRIRFGGDQGRIVLYVAFALIALIVALITKAFPGLQEQMAQTLSRFGMKAIMLAAVGASGVLFIICYLLGIHWIECKEF